jgi:ketosteroid isomerase-like protein
MAMGCGNKEEKMSARRKCLKYIAAGVMGLAVAGSSACLEPTPSIKDLGRRVQVLEDLEEIKKLHQKYINLMDNLRYEQVLELFTEDAIVEIRNYGIRRGRKEISEVYIGILAKNRGDKRYDGHMAVEPDIRINGNTARGSWLIYMLFSKPSIQWVQGMNECEYRKERGEWRISRLKFTRTLASDPALYP